MRDLGHFDDLLGDVEIEVPAHLHQLVHHRRHRNGHHVGDVFHRAQLDPFLWSLRLGQAGRPHSSLGVLPRQTAGRTPGEEGTSVAMARCTCPRAPPPRPWPPSGAVRCGATSRPGPGPSRRSSAHAAPSHAAKGCPLATLT